MSDKSSKTTELTQQAFDLFSVDNFFDLNAAYVKEDQILFKSREWSDSDPNQLINKLMMILKQIDLDELSFEDREWCQEIIWFWYHHAISIAIWKYRDRILARGYAAWALKYQTPDHPNKITKLLFLLVNDKLTEAKEWVKEISNDRDTADELIAEYEAGKFFQSHHAQA